MSLKWVISRWDPFEILAFLLVKPTIRNAINAPWADFLLAISTLLASALHWRAQVSLYNIALVLVPLAEM
jgi:hypothetical protein